LQPAIAPLWLSGAWGFGIALFDKRLVEILAADAALTHRYRPLTSIQAFDPVLVYTLFARLAELGQMSRKQPRIVAVHLVWVG
jgi:hypothetical protein